MRLIRTGLFAGAGDGLRARVPTSFSGLADALGTRLGDETVGDSHR
jgi:hypothetical protein